MSLPSEKFRILRYIVPFILVLVFFSFTGRSFRRVPWYESMIWNILEPPQKVFNYLADGTTGLWRRYAGLIDAQKENEALKENLAKLEGESIRITEVEKENQRLKDLLNYHEIFSHRTITSKVVASDTRAEFKSCTINRGRADGIEPLMPVVGPRGLVGKVGKASANEAQVILITDPNSAVDAFVQRSRARGMVVGAAWGTELKAGYYLTRLEYLTARSDLRDDDIVVTSGLDTVFPPGIPIGTVKDLRTSRYGVFLDANVVPFENMAELEEVAVVIGADR